ncbi:hypothetical protein [Paenibacillus sinopodophylli]|uniref:hypothetical protein n=1 Tax=Paenibacillus sinopodophylli TaxID=1837342 RepID=UPI00110CE083|nr:hypothetical protein [Paenibacillus sinopodophylli]
MRSGWRTRSHFKMGLSRDGGKTWTQEVVNVRELSPEQGSVEVGDIFWFRKSQFVVEIHGGKLTAIAIR